MKQLCFPILEHLRSLITAPNAEERPLIDALARAGVQCRFVDWLDVESWSSADAVSPKYLWGYHVWAAEFSAFVDALAGVHAVNHRDLLRWNFDKSYLAELQSSGFSVAEVVVIPQGEPVNLAHLAAERGWDEVVIKPSVSAGSQDTYRSEGPIQALQSAADHVLTRCSLLVQPFFEEIIRDGETSLLFFDGQLGHAVLRRPSPGDFRAHPMFGGEVQPTTPAPELVGRCGELLQSLPHLPTYARIDGFTKRGEFLITEVELIDPMLFCGAAPARSIERAAEAFAAAVEA